MFVEALSDLHELMWISDDKRATINYHNIRDEYNEGSYHTGSNDPIVIKKVSEKSAEIFECYSRHHYMSSVHGLDTQDYFALLCDHVRWALSLIDRFKPDYLIFANMPHEGYDNVLYEVAQIRSIRTLRLFQVPFAPRHWALHGCDRISLVTSIPRNDNQPLFDQFIQNFLQELDGKESYFYMKRIAPAGILSWVRVLDLVMQRRKKLVAIALLSRLRHGMYRRRLSRHVDILDINMVPDDYGYFALHLQPELTTSALGNGLYFNQLLAVRDFAGRCEALGLCAVVKDNPKQTFSHRSQHFFNSLSSISNVRIVNSDVSSFSLLKRAKLVGTITGTVGLESLRRGIPVVCYGDGWWEWFTGVISAGQEPAPPTDLSCIAHNFCADEIKQKLYGELRSVLMASFPGCSDGFYTKSFGVDPRENAQQLVRSVGRLISEQSELALPCS